MTATLPSHEYSLKCMAKAIDELTLPHETHGLTRESSHGEIKLVKSDDHLITLELPQGKTIRDYHPSEFSYGYDLPEQSTLLCLALPELVDIAFTAHSTTKNIESKAVIIPHKGLVYVEDEDALYDFTSFQKNYEFEAPCSLLLELNSPENFTENDFWAVIDTICWEKNSDHDKGRDLLVSKHDHQTLAAIESAYSLKFAQLYEKNLKFSGNSYDTYCDLLGFVVSQGKDVYEQVLSGEQDLEDVYGEGFNPDFGMVIPHVHQQEHYPYRTFISDNKEMNKLETKYSRLLSIQVLKNVDFDQIIPALHQETKQRINEAIVRLTAIGNGNYVDAFNGFGQAAYSRLGKIAGTEFGYMASNTIAEFMAMQGKDWKQFP